MDKQFWKYKGRLVLRGDTVRDETGFYAVFSEQGTSASHIEAAKMMDALARFPGCSGENADASSAYTQVNMSEVPALLGKEYTAETWVRIPKHRRPASWNHIDDPVVPLKVNLYGHPCAGLFWEKYCERALKRCGFQRVPGWECLYFNPAKKLFLSVYVER